MLRYPNALWYYCVNSDEYLGRDANLTIDISKIIINKNNLFKFQNMLVTIGAQNIFGNRPWHNNLVFHFVELMTF